MRKLILALAVVVMCGGMTGCYIPTQQMTTRQYIEVDVANKKAASIHRAEEGLQSVQKIPKLPKNWKQLVQNAIARYLKDPDSAKYSFYDNPKFYSFSNSGFFAKSAEFVVPTSPLLGHAGLVFVNAKNSYGGYTGNTPWLYMITNGEISLIATNNYGVWHTIDDVRSHMDMSYTEAMLLKSE